MAIITLSHGAFTGGSEIAGKVASELGYRCISREVLLEASTRYGIAEAKFTEVLETEGHWWERWIESLRLYRITLQAAMCEVAQGGNMIYHGRAGQALFPGVSVVIRVLTVADTPTRIKRAHAQRGGDDESLARYLKELDRVRNRRLRSLFNIDWQDPLLYDLVINTTRVSSDTAAALIAEAARRVDKDPSVASGKALADLTTTARVQAALITAPRTRNVILNVQSDGGHVRISGILADSELEKEIVEIARKVEGVTEVTTDIEPPPIEYMHP